MTSLFEWTVQRPFHLSVGAVLTNKSGHICVHHYRAKDIGEEYQLGMGEATEYYVLMRETVENNEPLEETLRRGLREELGATGKIQEYIGSILSLFPKKGVVVEKTTVYFHVTCDTFDSSLREKDGESKSAIEWIEAHRLLELMENQGSLMSRTDRDEAKIVKTYLGRLDR